MRTSNPTLNQNTFAGTALGSAQPMTLQGTVNKTAILLMLVFGSAVFAWKTVLANPSTTGLFAWGGAIAGLILCLVTVFKKEWAAITSPLYAIAEGLTLGAISMWVDQFYPGIVLQAVLLTIGVLLAMLGAYTMRIIRATEKFRTGVIAATGGIFLVYLLTMVLGFFHIRVPYIHDSGMVGIGFSLFVVVIAALNLVLDFDLIENGCRHGAPKYMEWYGAFGLLVTLVWLYFEILRLLTKLANRRG
jgi:uncharacterized YccA/Bax inhibitor family protein